MIPEVRLSAIVEAIKSAFSLGGFLYFIDLFRKRARIRVWILKEEFYREMPPAVTIEVQNIGLTPTSIEPVVLLKAFLPRPGRTRNERFRLERYEVTFNIEGLERALPSYVPMRLKAVNERVDAELSTKLGFTWFKTYTFKFARGRKRKVRIRSADRVPLPWWRYVYERLDFKLRGHVTLPPELEREVSDALSR
ncbi:MAG: hypothetical protein WA005_08430 [Candidatus Binataceae bacterium]